jgi:hypothetical protein
MAEKRSEVIQGEIDKLTAELAAAIARRDDLQKQAADLGERMHDLTGDEQAKADRKFRELVVENTIAANYIETFTKPLERRRVELQTAMDQEWKHFRLAEIADARRQCEKICAMAEAEFDESLRTAAGVALRILLATQAVGRLFGVTDPLRIFGGASSNPFERAALASGLQSVEHRDVGRISVLRLPGTSSWKDEENPPSVAGFLAEAFSAWTEAALKELELTPQMRELARELDQR